jgi:hypothetical protein
MNIPKNQPSPQRTVAVRLEDIPPGREGWVYPIHTPSTNPYKIGRSVHPVFYFQEFTTQLLKDSLWRATGYPHYQYIPQKISPWYGSSPKGASGFEGVPFNEIYYSRSECLRTQSCL